MDFDLAEKYASAHTSALSPLINELLDYTLANHTQSHMVSGAVQGQFLRMVSRLLNPTRILEIGTFTGFSALCMLEGLVPEGTLYTLELREEDARTAQSYFDRHPNGQQIKLLSGNALDLLPGLTETWDLVFLDADKTGYAAYYEMIIPQLRKGGLLIADNVLFHGQVLTEPLKGKNAIALDAFTKKVLTDERVEQVLLTVRDGLLMVQKK